MLQNCRGEKMIERTNLEVYDYILNKDLVNLLEPSDIELAKELREKAASAYYNSDSIILLDNQFDILTKVIKKYTKEDLPVGAVPTKKMINTSHEFTQLVGTLQDETDLNEIKKWLTDYNNYYIGYSHKYDGNSATLYFNPNTGRLIKAVTRGRDNQGVDLTNLFKDITIDITEFAFDNITENDVVAVKCECVLTYENFEKLKLATGKEYKNPRNTVNGILSRLDGERFSKYLSLYALEARLTFRSDFNSFTDREAEYELLKKIWSGPIINLEFIKNINSLEDLMIQLQNILNNVMDTRLTLPYMIDGVVIEICNKNIKEKVGWVSNFPRYAKAFKFPSNEVLTTIESFEFDYGFKTSIITPCVIIKEVKLIGNTYRRISLANFKRFEELKLGIGSKVIFSLSMDVLGYIEPFECEENKSIVPAEFISECPICKGDLEINENGTFVYCINPECDGRKVGDIISYVEHMEIMNVGEEKILTLYEAGLLNKISDLYTLNVDEVKNLEKFGDLSARNLIGEINLVNKVNDWKFFPAFPIEGLGTTACKNIFKKHKFEIFFTKTEEEIVEILMTKKIEGIGEIMANKFAKLFSKFKDEMKECMKYIEIVSTTKEIAISNGEKYNIVVTGDLNCGSRDAFKNFLDDLGHKMTGSISGKTNFLIMNPLSDPRGKYEKAKKMNIPVLTEEEFLNLIGVDPTIKI